ncbi:hypothetical protein ACFVXG_42200 [Kitasatospora sp. NPDC058162]
MKRSSITRIAVAAAAALGIATVAVLTAATPTAQAVAGDHFILTIQTAK